MRMGEPPIFNGILKSLGVKRNILIYNVTSIVTFSFRKGVINILKQRKNITVMQRAKKNDRIRGCPLCSI